MRISLLNTVKSLVGTIKSTNGLKDCHASCLSSLDGSKYRNYVELKLLILLPEGQKLTDEIAENLNKSLNLYGKENSVCIQARLEQLSIRYALLTVRLQDNDAVDFTYISYQQHQRNVWKETNRKKVLELKKEVEKEKQKLSVWTKFKKLFRVPF